MGKLNLLKAGYEGKLGQTYGVAKKGLYDIKVIPFSHTPHNNSQTSAKNEFTGLNRIASAVVKKMWSYLSLSDKKMYRNNALCQLWKDALVGRDFHIDSLKRVIDQDGALKITEKLYDPQKFKFIYSVQELFPNEESANQQIYLAVVTNKNITKADITGKGNNLILSSMFDYIDFAYFQVWTFKARKGIKKWQLKGLSISDPIFVVIVNGIFFVNRWHWQAVPFMIGGVLYFSSDNVKIENGVLKLLTT